jgi:hypothetical protein
VLYSNSVTPILGRQNYKVGDGTVAMSGRINARVLAFPSGR